MSLVVTCNKCGQTISLRKMPHGRHVPFDLRTNNPHKCGSRKSSKGKGAEAGGRKNLPTKASEVLGFEAELPLLSQTSDKGAFSRESMTKYENFFASATPPKAQDACPLNAKEDSLGPRPWVWAVLLSLITALLVSLYLNLTAKPKVIVVEKKITVTARSDAEIQADKLSREGNKAEGAKDYDFIPDPEQQKQGN